MTSQLNQIVNESNAVILPSVPETEASIIRTLPTPLLLDDFEIGVTLGTGSFGRVRFTTHKVNFIQTL